MALCRIFKQAIRAAGLPKYLTSDHDPLYRFHQWEANLRVLGVTEIHSVVPSVRRATDRHNPQRMFGPAVVLDGNGSRDETDRNPRVVNGENDSAGCST